MAYKLNNKTKTIQKEDKSLNYNRLSHNWNVWFHKSNDNNWDFNSYIKLTKFDNIESYGVIMNTFKPCHIQNAMLFIMKNNIKPMWEADENKNGSCISFKIYKNNIYNAWIQLNNHLISEQILKDENNENLNEKINGISISPKKTFSIIKIWFSDNSNYISLLNNINLFNTDEAIFKKHIEN